MIFFLSLIFLFFFHHVTSITVLSNFNLVSRVFFLCVTLILSLSFLFLFFILRIFIAIFFIIILLLVSFISPCVYFPFVLLTLSLLFITIIHLLLLLLFIIIVHHLTFIFIFYHRIFGLISGSICYFDPFFLVLSLFSLFFFFCSFFFITILILISFMLPCVSYFLSNFPVLLFTVFLLF